MKKILLVCLMAVLMLSGCGKAEIDLVDTTGRVLAPGEAKGMLGVEGKIEELNDETLSVIVEDKIITFERTDSFDKELENAKKKGKIKEGTYVQVYYEEEIIKQSAEYKDVKTTKNIAKGISLVTANWWIM